MTAKEFFFGQRGDPPDKRVPADWVIVGLIIAGGTVILGAFFIWFFTTGIQRLLDCNGQLYQ